MNDDFALQVEDLGVSLRGKALLADLSFDVRPGEWLGIVGPNGSGKSTLLQALVGFLKPKQGSIRIEGQRLDQLSALQRARIMAYIQQEASPMPGFRVSSFLELAFHPLEGVYDQGVWQEECAALCKEFQLENRQSSPLAELSGGERQRVLLVQSLLQKPKILLLDELTNHLDIYFQLEIMKKLQALPLTKVTVLHDLNLAARYCDRILSLQVGRNSGWGKPSEVLTEENLYRLYGVHCEVTRVGDSVSQIRWA